MNTKKNTPPKETQAKTHHLLFLLLPAEGRVSKQLFFLFLHHNKSDPDYTDGSEGVKHKIGGRRGRKNPGACVHCSVHRKSIGHLGRQRAASLSWWKWGGEGHSSPTRKSCASAQILVHPFFFFIVQIPLSARQCSWCTLGKTD